MAADQTQAIPSSKFVAPHAEKVVQKRLLARGRRRLLRLTSVGWCMVDVLAAGFSVLLAFAVSPYSDGMRFGARDVPLIPCLLGFMIVLPMTAHIAGLHDPRYSRSRKTLVIRAVSVIWITLTILLVAFWLIHYWRIGRYVMLTMAISSTALIVGSRLLASAFSQASAPTVCFLGDQEFCKRVKSMVERHKLDVNVYTAADLPQNASSEDMDIWAINHNVDDVVYDASWSLSNDEGLLRCLDQGIRVQTFSDFIEDSLFLVPVEQIDSSWLFGARLDLARPYYNGIKRLIDVVAAGIGFLLTAPLLLAVIVMIKLGSKGPAIYSQIRIGRFNRKFKIYKLRTMVQDAESNGAQWASVGDSRVTRLGAILRKTRIDELPQLWNIIRGDMSLIGPRPERPEFVEMLGDVLPFYMQRHLVKPGLTGWAQINYPYGASVEDSLHKLTYDLFYVKKSSFGLDLQILLRTVGAVSKGAR